MIAIQNIHYNNRNPIVKLTHLIFLMSITSNIILSNSGRRNVVTAFSFVTKKTTKSSWISIHNTPLQSTCIQSIHRKFSIFQTQNQIPLNKEFKRFSNKRLFSNIQTNDVTSNNFASDGPVYPSFNPNDYAIPSFPSIITTPELKTGQRIVSFGDVHGDISALKNFLVTAQIMDPKSTPENPIWSGGDTICVQCGDILDRGDDELKCIRLLASLARQAQQAGGALLMCYGNHEALNSVGLFQYANPGGNIEFEQYLGAQIDLDWKNQKWRLQYANNEPARWAAFEPGGIFAQTLMANMKVSVVLGRTVFVHAGLTKQHIDKYKSIENMNDEATKWITKTQHGPNNNLGTYTQVEEVIQAAESRARAHSSSMPECLGGGIGSHSPVWMRDYSSPHDSQPTNPMAQQMMNLALDAITSTISSESSKAEVEVQRMVMGHTPQSKINAALQGKAWRIDVGASKGVMSGTPEVLEIIHGGVGNEDVISILTMSKSASGEQIKNSMVKRIDGTKRYLAEMPIM